MIGEFVNDEAGTTMVEMALVATLLLVLVLGFVDFGYAFYQWNAASKAVQVGGRLAAISNPVAANLPNEGGFPSNTADVGNPIPANAYDYVCTANAAGVASCTCNATTTGSCSNTVNQGAFNLILNGDASRPGMKTFFPALKPSEVRIEYVATGLGYWTRPGGPVPTIKVSIVNHPFQFFFLGGLLGFANITMPNMLSTVTGEDMSTSYTSP